MSGEPVEILKETENAILVSEEIDRGMIETLSLVSIPGVRESVLSGMLEPIADTKTCLEWKDERVVGQLFNGKWSCLSMLQSKIFANGSTTLPKHVRDALDIKIIRGLNMVDNS